MTGMKMHKVFLGALYIVMGLGIIYLGHKFISLHRQKENTPPQEYCVVKVTGNVQSPGLYRVPSGTSRFRILKMAGIRATSDISHLNLTKEIFSSDTLYIKTLKDPVSMKPDESLIRLRYLLGTINVVKEDGDNRQIVPGMSISEKDRIIVESNSQVEFSINAYSHVDINGFAELVVDNIGLDEKKTSVTKLYQKSGMCWYRIVYSTSSEHYDIVTPLMQVTVQSTRSEFMVDVKQNSVEIHITDGRLFIRSILGDETANVITGESAIIEKGGRSIRVKNLIPDFSPRRIFSKLLTTKTKQMQSRMPLTFLLCGIPSVYYYVCVDFENAVTHTVNIPPETSIDQFVYGVSTVNQSFLYGGPTLTSSLVERLLNIRITNYCIFDKRRLTNLAASIGGISINVDKKAASEIGISPGKQKLSGNALAQFVRPSLSGWKDSQARQTLLIKSTFEEIRSKNIIMTSLLCKQIVSNMETNFSSADLLKQYTKFSSRRGWKLKEYYLPGKKLRKDKQMIYEPDLDKCRSLIK